MRRRWGGQRRSERRRRSVGEQAPSQADPSPQAPSSARGRLPQSAMVQEGASHGLLNRCLYQEFAISREHKYRFVPPLRFTTPLSPCVADTSHPPRAHSLAMESRQHLIFDADRDSQHGDESETSSDTIEMSGFEEVPVTPARRNQYSPARYNADSDDDSDVEDAGEQALLGSRTRTRGRERSEDRPTSTLGQVKRIVLEVSIFLDLSGFSLTKIADGTYPTTDHCRPSLYGRNIGERLGKSRLSACSLRSDLNEALESHDAYRRAHYDHTRHSEPQGESRDESLSKARHFCEHGRPRHSRQAPLNHSWEPHPSSSPGNSRVILRCMCGLSHEYACSWTCRCERRRPTDGLGNRDRLTIHCSWPSSQAQASSADSTTALWWSRVSVTVASFAQRVVSRSEPFLQIRHGCILGHVRRVLVKCTSWVFHVWFSRAMSEVWVGSRYATFILSALTSI